LYDEPLKKVGIEPVVLSAERQNDVDELIYSEIIHRKPDVATTTKMQVFIDELKALGCDAFIAGCTEIPVVIASEADSALPFIDTTRLLARKAFKEAIQ
jgi:aspartate racemase